MSDVANLCGIGMVTAVGGCTEQTVTSVQSGINRYQDSSVLNKRFVPMTLALFPDDDLPPLHESLAGSALTSRQARMLRLAHLALIETLDGWPAGTPLPLFVAGPEPVEERPAAAGDDFVQLLQSQADVAFDTEHGGVFTSGRAGGMQAIAAAMDYLRQGHGEAALVGGVDSYLDLYLLATLDRDDRVLAEGVMDGFAPGEGAGFLLLCSDSAAKSHSLRPSATLHSPGIAEEAGHRYSDEPYRGDGLDGAVKQALTGSGEPIRTVLASINGENFGAKEWGVTVSRNQGAFDADFRFEHPADCFGDIGAAFAPVLVGLASAGMRSGFLPGPCLAWCSSEHEQRAAAVISPAAG